MGAHNGPHIRRQLESKDNMADHQQEHWRGWKGCRWCACTHAHAMGPTASNMSSSSKDVPCNRSEHATYLSQRWAYLAVLWTKKDMS